MSNTLREMASITNIRDQGMKGSPIGRTPGKPPKTSSSLSLPPLLASQPGSPGLVSESSQEFGSRQGIDDIFLLEPAPARHGDAVADEGQIGRVVRVRRDDHLDAALLAHAQINVLQIKSVGVRVAFHGDAMFCASVEDLLHVVVERIAAEQQAARGMGNDLGIGVLDGREHALRHGGAVEVEIGVDRANHYVELRKNFV